MVVTASFVGLAYYIGGALVLFAALATAGDMRLRRRAGWKRLPALDLAFPLIPAVFILASLWMLAYAFWSKPAVAAACALTLGTGAVIYGWKFRGVPKTNLDPSKTAN
jgi:amino acid transporter